MKLSPRRTVNKFVTKIEFISCLTKHVMRALIGGLVIFFAVSVQAQDKNPPHEETSDKNDSDVQKASDKSTDKSDAEEPREITAAELNARQRIDQTLTVTRFINGKPVETKKVALPTGPGMPVRETEAGGRLADVVRAQVDREVLTRREAFEEARLEFDLVDTNSDQLLTRKEFVSLVEVRQDDPNYASFFTPATTVTNAENSTALAQHRAIFDVQGLAARFDFVTGVSRVLTKQIFIAEALRDFDSLDANGDAILRDAELIAYRRALLGISGGASGE